MGYSEYLKQLLRPIGVYDLSDGSYNSAELEVLGEALDDCCSEIEALEQEYTVSPAKTYSLRAKIPSVNQLQSKNRLNEVLSSCGTAIMVEESTENSTVIVSFPSTIGKPDNFSELQVWIESVLPCHLEIIYSFDAIDVL